MSDLHLGFVSTASVLTPFLASQSSPASMPCDFLLETKLMLRLPITKNCASTSQSTQQKSSSPGSAGTTWVPCQHAYIARCPRVHTAAQSVLGPERRIFQRYGDIAVLLVDRAVAKACIQGPSPKRIDHPGRICAGMPVRVVSSPFGLVSPAMLFNSVTHGVVSNTSRHNPPALLFTDARCLPGAEGGCVTALCDGRLVGLVAVPLPGKRLKALAPVVSIDAVRDAIRDIGARDDKHCAQGESKGETNLGSSVSDCVGTTGAAWSVEGGACLSRGSTRGDPGCCHIAGQHARLQASRYRHAARCTAFIRVRRWLSCLVVRECGCSCVLV